MIKIFHVMLMMLFFTHTMVAMIKEHDKIECNDLHLGFDHLKFVEYQRPVLNADGTFTPGKVKWLVPTPDGTVNWRRASNAQNRHVLAECAVTVRDQDTIASWERELFDWMSQGAHLFVFEFPEKCYSQTNYVNNAHDVKVGNFSCV